MSVPTNRAAAPVSPYAELGMAYGEELSRNSLRTALVAHRWQHSDLIAPFSDVDLRVVLDRQPDDWLQWNIRLAAVHRELVQGPHGDVLRHPPDYAFTAAEVDDGAVPAAELATWDLLHGSASALRRWQADLQLIPWSAFDENYYWDLVRSRHAEVRRTIPGAPKAPSDHVAHRVAWRYFATCWFAAASLATRTRCPSRNAALTQWRPPSLASAAAPLLDVLGKEARSQVPQAHDELLFVADHAVEAMLSQISSGNPQPGQLALQGDWARISALLRVRPTHWLVTLASTPGPDMTFMLRREETVLSRVAERLQAFAADQASGRAQVAAKMIRLLPQRPISPAHLDKALDGWRRSRELINHVLCAPTALSNSVARSES